MINNKLISLVVISLLISNTFCQIGITADYAKEAGKQVYLGKNDNVYMYATLVKTALNLDVTLYAYTAKSSYSGTAWAGIGFGTTQMNGSDMVICTENNGTRECTDWTGASTFANKDDTQSVSNVTYAKVSLSTDYSPYTALLVWKFTKTLSVSSMTKYDSDSLDIIACWGENFNGSNSAEHSYKWQFIVSADGNNQAYRPELVAGDLVQVNLAASTNTNVDDTNINTNTNTNTNNNISYLQASLVTIFTILIFLF